MNRFHPRGTKVGVHSAYTKADEIIMESFALMLGRERVQLEFLLFKILQLQHLLRSGDHRFVRWSVDEIGRAGERLAITERTRAEQLATMARRLAVAEPATLDAVTTAAPEPWRTILTDHALAVRVLNVEVAEAFESAYALAEISGHSVAQELAALRRRTPADVIALP